MGKTIRLAAAALLLAVPLLGQGELLPRSEDITNVKLMRTMAMDTGDRVTVTAAGNLQRSDGESRPPLIQKAEGDTVFACTRTMEQQCDGTLEFGHVTEVLMGEGLARQGMEDEMDYLERDFSMRMSAKLFLVLGDTGEAVLRGGSSAGSAVTDRLTAISEDLSLRGSGSWPYTLRQMTAETAENGCTLMPAITLSDNPDYSGAEDEPEKLLSFAGLALIQNRRFTGMLTEEETKGVSLLENRDQRDSIEVTLYNNENQQGALQLIGSRCRLIPFYNEQGELRGVNVSIYVRADLSELRGDWNPMNEADRREVERALSEKLAAQAAAALARSLSEKADFMGMKGRLLAAQPLHTRAILDAWEKGFETVPWTVTVSSVLRRSYDINQPA